jgi:hypothetical protein
VPPTTFEGLIDRVDRLLQDRGETLPDRARIAQVHGMRNDAQHRGRPPSGEQASDARTYTRDAVEQLTHVVWGESFAMLRLSDAIRHDTTRGQVARAEEELGAGEHQAAARTAYYAMWKTLNRVDDIFVGRKVRSPLPGAELRAIGERERRDKTAEMQRALARMQRTIVQLAVERRRCFSLWARHGPPHLNSWRSARMGRDGSRS